MPIINIENLVMFAPNIGVMVGKESLSTSPQHLFDLVKLAHAHMNDEPLVEACCAGAGPLAKYSELMMDEYLQLLQQVKQQKQLVQASLDAKQIHTKIRRSDFSAKRSRLVLAMIDAGVPFACAHPGCNSTEDITVDHITPLSRGGTDDLSNLQFLCRRHNSAKNDKHHA